MLSTSGLMSVSIRCCCQFSLDVKAGPMLLSPYPGICIICMRHVRINRRDNVTKIEAAVADRCGVVPLREDASSYEGRIATSDGDFQASVVSLDALVSNGEVGTPDFVKIDVEGAEMLVLSGAASLLAEAHPTIVLSAHSDELREQCGDSLASFGYCVQPIGGESIQDTWDFIASRA